MFFDDPSTIDQITKLSGFSIFAMPKSFWPSPNRILTITPNEKGNIIKEQIDACLEFAKTKHATDQFIFIHSADKMVASAENALLKLLEEPNTNLHIVFFTENPKLLLPTVLSRARLYFLRQTIDFSAPLEQDKATIDLAKSLISATGKSLIPTTENLLKSIKKSDETRPKVLEIVRTAIEILYKSYLVTGNSAFLSKLEKFLTLHENLIKNGHIKLHLIADLI